MLKNMINKKGDKNLTCHSCKQAWCKIVDAFQTAAIDAQDDYKLKHLVEVFRLSGDLV